MRPLMYGLWAMMASVLVGLGGARAASIDCKKAASRVEHLICDDTNLQNLESQLEGAYQGALDRSIHPARVTQEQRAWLRERDACTDQGCMTASYTRRISALSKVSDQPAICFSEITYQINACGAEYARRAERQLARYLAAARNRLLEEARDPVRPIPAKLALPALDAAQKRWLAFRKAECAAVYDWYSDGTIRGAEFEGCIEGMTDDRTEEVWSTWLTFDNDSTPPLMPKPTKH